MDIREWLQNTADRKPPEEQECPSRSEPSQPQRRASRPVRSGQREPASGDPGLKGAHRQSLEERNQRISHSSSSDHQHAAKGAAANWPSSDISEDGCSSVSAQAQEPIKSFERRARHKTRPDRYEAKTKKVKQNRRSGSKAKSKRRTRHRGGDGARTTGLVQSFQLKDGPKSNRLTLRPEASIGIFSNGRASAPMAAHGPGLPDLVFNEMKFLSGSKDVQGHAAANEVSNRSKKSRKELREEEISSYFRNVTAERRTEQSHQSNATPGEDSQVQPAAKEGPLTRHSAEFRHLAKLSQKPVSGTGSRGELRGDSISRSCFTWSESVAPVQKAPPRQIQRVPSGQTYPRQPPAHGCSHGSHTSSISLPQRQRHTANDSLVPEKLDQAGPTAPHKARKVSRKRRCSHELLPYLESALGSTPSASRYRPTVTPRAAIDGSGSDRHRTSDILVLHEMRGSRGGSPSLPQQRSASQPDADQENTDPITSTPASTFLREALNVVAKPPQNFDSSPRRDGPRFTATNVVQTRPNATYTASLISPAQYVDSHGRPLLVESPHAQVHRRGFSRGGQIDEHEKGQSLRREFAATSNTKGFAMPTPLAPFPQRYERSFTPDIVVPDNQWPITWLGMREWPSNTSNRQADEIFHQLAEHAMPDSYAPSAILQDVEGEETCFMQPQEELEGHMFGTEPHQTLAQDDLKTCEDAEDPGIEPFVEAEEPQEAMAGFWRPNILY